MNHALGHEENSPARRVLERLLRRSEAATLAGDPRPATLSMRGTRDGAEYRALRGVADFELFHAQIRLAERAGAVVVERERNRDDGQRLLRISVGDAGALARELGMELLQARVTRAEQALTPWRLKFPVLEAVIEAWRCGGKVRGQPVDAVADLVDAALAVATLQNEDRAERILRRASVDLFNDSKRLEALTVWLDLLLTGELAPTGLEPTQVWAAMGLRREPQPLLVAGQGMIELDDGSVYPLPRHWLGFPVDAVCSMTSDAHALLSIENLASFHEAAAMRGDRPVLLLYTGGMPSPAWRLAYSRLVAGLSPAASVYHWGDIDRGGFRIAAKLAEIVATSNRRLQPWLMSPDQVPVTTVANAQAPSAQVLGTMCEWASRAGWGDVADALQRTPILLEQEALAPRLPDC